MYSYLIAQQSIVHELRNSVDCITVRFDDGRLVVDARHASGTLLPLRLRSFERVMVRRVRKLYATNDTGRAIEFDIDMCFEARARAGDTPEQTGHIQTVIEARNQYDGIVADHERLLYEPNMYNLGYDLTPFIGMEHSIGCARSGSILPATLFPDGQNFEIFLDTDPFFVFMLHHKALMQWPERDVEPIASHKGHFRVAKTTAERVRAFAARTLFPMFHYTVGESLRFACRALDDGPAAPVDPAATATVMFEVEYIVICQSVPKFIDTSMRMKI